MNKNILIIMYLSLVAYLCFGVNLFRGEEMTTYIVYKDGNIIKAENESTENIDFSDADISNILISINGAISAGDTVIIRDGIYNPGSQIIFTKSIKLIAEGNVIFNWNITSEDLFVFNGTELGKTEISGNVAIGTNTVAVTNAGGVIPGDLLLIYDNTIWNPGSYPTWKTGELHEISSISGNVITIADNTINSFSVVQSGTVILIRPITIEINGIVINGADSKLDYYGIELNYNKNSIIRNSKLQNNGIREIDIRNSYNTIVENNSISNSLFPGYGYGVSVSDASAFTTITNNYFDNSYQSVMLGGYGVVGQSRDTNVSFNIFLKVQSINGAVLNAHEIAESYYIYNNTISSPSTEYAVVSGAKITKFTGNTINGGKGLTIGTPPGPIICDISNNTFMNSEGIFRFVDILPVPHVINIKNNTITGNIKRIVRMNNITSFIISGNQFDSALTNDGFDAITLDTSSNGIISNNFIHNSYGEGLSMSNVNNTIVSNNTIKDYNNAGTNGNYGIDLNNSINNTISDNLLMRIGDLNTYGIGEFGTSDYNYIFENGLTNVGSNARIHQRLVVVGSHSKIWKNPGFLSENDVLSGTFAVDAIGLKTVRIAHGLAITPNIQDCYLTVVKNTNVTDWRYTSLMVNNVDSIYVTVNIYISTPSATNGATAKLALKVGNP